MAQNYGRLGGGSRRGGSGSWQWVLLGFLPGILCGGLVLFALSLTNVLDLSSLSEQTPIVVTSSEQVVMVVTATDDPSQPTLAPIVITATPEPSTPTTVAVVVPSTPTSEPDVQINAGDDGQAQSSAVTVATPVQVVPNNSAGLAAEEAGSGVQANSATGGVNAGTTGSSTGVGVVDPTGNQLPEALVGVPSTTVVIQGGVFEMGTTPDEVLIAVNQCVERDAGNCQLSYGEDSTPAFQVQLPNYRIESTEVTFSQYASFLNHLQSQGQTHLNGCSGFICIQTGNERPGDAVIIFNGATYTVQGNLAAHPAYAVTWYGADSYCRAIGRRLPTEAEWERAARGDDGRIYPWGNEWNPALAQTGRPATGERVPVAVGSFPSAISPYNALDMAGNVAEWVNDWYNPAYYSQQASQQQPVQNPAGPPTGVEKVLRGGSWDALPFFARTVHRQSFVPAPDNPEADFPRYIGFRCVEDIDPNAPIAPASGVDPSTLGTIAEEPAAPANAQPTLQPAAPTVIPAETQEPVSSS